MKKPNRRSKQKSGSDSSSSPSIVSSDKENKRIRDLELENEALKREIEELRSKFGDVTPISCVGVQKLNQVYPQNSKTFAGQVVESKKLGIQSQLSAQKLKSDETSKQFQDEIQRLKVQKVQLQCKMKLESMQFRLCKASLEKEILQLKKEQRRNNYEKQVLSTLNQRQKHVLQRKTEEAFLMVKRLKELIESRKTSSGKIAGARNGSKIGTQGQLFDDCNDSASEMALVQGIEHDFEVKMKLDEACSKYEHRIEKMVDEIKKLKLEVEMLREEQAGCRSQDNEAVINDSELIDLREEVDKLSCMVSQMNMSKAPLIQTERSQVDLVQTSVSIGSNIHSSDMDTSESEHSEGVIAMIERPSGVCCSCSKKSLCKTLKCGCRAAGSSCGISCGCAIAKCTNREKVPFKLDDMPQPEMTKDIVPCNIEEEKGTVQDAMLLQNKVVEKLPEINEDCETRKQPLREIGNTMIKSITGNIGPRKKAQKAVVQPDTMNPPLSLLEGTRGTRKTNKNSG
ncbi:kinesin-like protein KIN-4C isoform X2 [Durio zibethinus]|uniref:Kinesin-like protein KIN-4C isoform X2 n=1 Tax=Durio zibethinus TaxID=66656 RepID=A0A6P6AUF4_DURZI|nr:kinesin-like protein KIN-4C isoform X2 [Durio zibethinus]